MKGTNMKPNPTFPLSDFPTFQLLLFAALPVLAMDGNRNAADGTGAGHEATGDFTTAAGQYAAAWATNAESSAFLGYRSGSVSKGAENCIGIGAYALDGSASCRGVVAVGSAALRGAQAVTNATCINNQFVAAEQSDMFYISPSPTNLPAAAPIYYRNGTLYLNAPQIVTRSGVIGSAQGGSSAGSTNAGIAVSFDLYVNGEGGSDSNDGLSAYTAKKTIDGALSLGSDDVTVCVMAGAYKFPQSFTAGGTGENDFPSRRVQLVAVSGPSITSIDGELNSGSERRLIRGSDLAWTVFEGFTFRNAAAAPPSDFTGVYETSYFYNCVFEDTAFAPSHARLPFMFCVLDCCRMKSTVTVSGSAATALYDCMGYGCEIYDSVLEWTNATNATGACNTFSNTRAVNCFIHAPDVARPPCNPSTALNVLGNRGAMIDTTFIAGSAAAFLGGTGVSYTNCLVGVTTNGAAWLPPLRATTYCDTASNVLGGVGSDYRPTSARPLWRWYGYGSEADRAQRDAIIETWRTLNQSGELQ